MTVRARRRLVSIVTVASLGLMILAYIFREGLEVQWWRWRFDSEDPDVSIGAAAWLLERGVIDAAPQMLDRVLDELEPYPFVSSSERTDLFVLCEKHWSGFGEPGLHLLVDRLGDPQTERSDVACLELISTFGEAGGLAVPAILEIVEGEFAAPVRMVAVETLGSIGQSAREALPALERLRDRIEDGDSRFRSRIGTAIEKIEGDFD